MIKNIVVGSGAQDIAVFLGILDELIKSKYVKLGGKIGHNIISSEKKASLLIACSEDSVEVEIIQKEGKKPVSASEFIIGYKGKNICFE